MTSNVSLVEVIFRLIVAMSAVLGLMWFLAKVMRSRLGIAAPTRRRGQTSHLEVIARQQLSRTSAVAVVRVGSKAFALGVSDTQVNALGEVDLNEFEVDVELNEQGSPGLNRTVLVGNSMRSGSTWKTAIEAVRERTVRK